MVGKESFLVPTEMPGKAQGYHISLIEVPSLKGIIKIAVEDKSRV